MCLVRTCRARACGDACVCALCYAGVRTRVCVRVGGDLMHKRSCAYRHMRMQAYPYHALAGIIVWLPAPFLCDALFTCIVGLQMRGVPDLEGVRAHAGLRQVLHVCALSCAHAQVSRLWTPAAARTACDNCMWGVRRVARAQAWTGATQRDCRVKSLRLVGLEVLQGEHTKQISSVARHARYGRNQK